MNEFSARRPSWRSPESEQQPVAEGKALTPQPCGNRVQQPALYLRAPRRTQMLVVKSPVKLSLVLMMYLVTDLDSRYYGLLRPGVFPYSYRLRRTTMAGFPLVWTVGASALVV